MSNLTSSSLKLYIFNEVKHSYSEKCYYAKNFYLKIVVSVENFKNKSTSINRNGGEYEPRTFCIYLIYYFNFHLFVNNL